jgi:HNH endonuclease/NUMOD4 motif-containing protein
VSSEATESHEEWRPVVGYEGSYEVSDHGTIRSIDRIVMRNGRPNRLRGQLLRPGRQKSGHRFVNLPGRNHRVHRLVLAAFVGPCPRGLEGCHENGDPSDNRLSNLRWGTHTSNNRDKQRHGTDPWRNRIVCPRGHPLVEPNLILGKVRRGHRQCLACDRGWGVIRRRGGDLQVESDKAFEAIRAGHISIARSSTTCNRGHEFAPKNTVIGSDGRRRCRRCQNIGQRRRKAQRNRHTVAEATRTVQPKPVS